MVKKRLFPRIHFHGDSLHWVLSLQSACHCGRLDPSLAQLIVYIFTFYMLLQLSEKAKQSKTVLLWKLKMSESTANSAAVASPFLLRKHLLINSCDPVREVDITLSCLNTTHKNQMLQSKVMSALFPPFIHAKYLVWTDSRMYIEILSSLSSLLGQECLRLLYLTGISLTTGSLHKTCSHVTFTVTFQYLRCS